VHIDLLLNNDALVIILHVIFILILFFGILIAVVLHFFFLFVGLFRVFRDRLLLGEGSFTMNVIVVIF
jgi:hypothetical protein